MAGDFAGWSKLVLPTPELALLAPRHHTMVEPLRRELEALRAVAPRGSPRSRAWWRCGRTPGSPYPIAAVTRLPGVILESVLDELDAERLGALRRDTRSGRRRAS